MGGLARSAAAAQFGGSQASPAAQSSAPSSSVDVLGKVKGWIGAGSAEADLLPPDEAYRLAVRAQDGDTLAATLTPAPGYYIYRDRVQFRVEAPPAASVSTVTDRKQAASTPYSAAAVSGRCWPPSSASAFCWRSRPACCRWFRSCPGSSPGTALP